MSKFHSTVTRRDFMKGLGLAGAGLGAAAAAAPVFSDLDAISSANGGYKEPWFVTERELENPTTEVDWQMMVPWERGPGGGNLQGRYSIGYGSSDPTIIAGSVFNNETKIPAYQAIQADNLKANVPGYQVQDFALGQAAGFLSFGRGLESIGWTGTRITTAQDRGVPKWTGTPEEATKLLQSAGHFLGMEKIGVIEVTSNVKKMWSPSQQWADIDQADPDDSSRTIPNKARWGLVLMIRQPLEATKKGPSPQNMASSYGYMYYPILKQRMMRFVKALGYQCLDRDVNSSNVGTGALVGNGELSRISHLFHHGWGTAMRYNPTILTDLPLAPTKPIDFGGTRFCETCKICGEVCLDINGLSPISMADKPTYEITGPWNRVGVKSFQFTWPYDYFCNFCQASCPWTNHGIAGIHAIIKATAATTGIFNAFFTNMEGVFGYDYYWDNTDRLGAFWDRNLKNDPFDVIWK